MTVLDIVGGLYGESCRFPSVDEIYGSGGRAAIALADAGHNVRWHYYCPINLQREACSALAAPNITHFPHNSANQINFFYMHPLSKPNYHPVNIIEAPSIKLDAKLVLRFGMMEGDAIVSAHACVYDPQSSNAVPFSRNGSTANSLAVVLNHDEIVQYAKALDEEQAINKISKDVDHSIVLVKAGAEGCRVYENGRLTATVPAYRSERIYKIGTGDIFSAAFADSWLINGCSVAESANHASRCVARYAETRNASTMAFEMNEKNCPAPTGVGGVVHIISSTSTLSRSWLMDQAYEALLDLGIAVSIDDQHLKNINNCKLKDNVSILALLDCLDPKTLLNVGCSIDAGFQVVAYTSESIEAFLRKEFLPNFETCTDFTAAIYKAIWAARS